jgi:hypothetical protein
MDEKTKYANRGWLQARQDDLWSLSHGKPDIAAETLTEWCGSVISIAPAWVSGKTKDRLRASCHRRIEILAKKR